MAIKRNTGQYALAAGTAVTTSTTGAPDAWTTLVIGGTGSITSQDQTTPNTKEVIRVTSDATTATYLGWTGVDAAAISCRGAFIIKTPSSFPSATTVLVKILSNGGGTSLGNINMTSAGKISYISDAGGTTDTATNALSVSTEYKVLWRMRNQTGTVADTLELEVYTASDVLVTGAGLSLSARNFGAVSPGTVRFGKNTATATMGAVDFSYLTYETSATAFTTMLPLPGSNAVPTATAPADVYSPTGTSISLTWTTADSDGTVVNLTVTQTEGPTLALSGTGLAARTATPTAPGVYRYSAVATDDLGGVSTPAVANVYIYDPSGSVYPYGFRNNTGSVWAPVGTADLVAAVVASSTTDYIETSAAPANAPITYDMNPMRPGAVVVNVNSELAPVAGAPCTLVVDVVQGGAGVDTVVATRTITLTDVWANYPLTLTSGELTAFSNRKQWAIRVTGNQT